MPVDDLNAPLGQDIRKKPGAAASIPWALIVGVLGLVVLAAAAGRLLLIRPTNTKPVASPMIVAPENARPEQTGSVPEKTSPETARTDVSPTVPGPAADKSKPSSTQTITIIDGTSGKREQIVIPVTPVPKR